MKKFIILISTTLLSLFYGNSFANNVNDEWNDAKWIAMEDVDTIVPYGIHLELGAKRILGEEVPFIDLNEPKGVVAKIKAFFAGLKK